RGVRSEPGGRRRRALRVPPRRRGGPGRGPRQPRDAPRRRAGLGRRRQRVVRPTGTAAGRRRRGAGGDLPSGVPRSAGPGDGAADLMTAEELLAFARGLDGVTVETADAASGAPEAAWGDSSVYHDAPGVDREPPDRRWPFATLVVHDYAGFDESS